MAAHHAIILHETSILEGNYYKLSQRNTFRYCQRLTNRDSHERASSSTQTEGQKFQGSLAFKEPIPPRILSGNLTLEQGCDTYITPDCIRRKSICRYQRRHQLSNSVIRTVWYPERNHQPRWEQDGRFPELEAALHAAGSRYLLLGFHRVSQADGV